VNAGAAPAWRRSNLTRDTASSTEHFVRMRKRHRWGVPLTSIAIVRPNARRQAYA